MSDDKKPAKNTKKPSKPDVEKPGKSAPSPTSKPVIVTHRPIMKDPMVVTDDDGAGEKKGKEDLAHTTGPKLQPLHKTEEKAEDKAEDQADEKAPESVEEKPGPQDEAPEAPTENSESKTENEPAAQEDSQGEAKTQQKADVEASQKKEQAAAVQKLIESRRYELPINAVEKRKTKRFVVLGILLAILLVLVWADIALDAGLIKVNGVKPVTHFFSN